MMTPLAHWLVLGVSVIFCGIYACLLLGLMFVIWRHRRSFLN